MTTTATTSIIGWKIKAANLLRSRFNTSRGDMFVLIAGTILAFMGTGQILGGLANVQLLELSDPIFGLPFHSLMLSLGIIELFIAFSCLFTNKRTLSLSLVAWVSANFIVYRIGMWSMGWHRSCGFLIDPLGLSLTATDVIFSLSSAFLLVGSITTLWLERRTVQMANFLKMSCPSCGVHIRFVIQNLGQIIPCPHCQKETTLRKPENIKMSCYFCKEHIEFPAHALGQKIKCPHCNRGITLMDPA
jgi:hypothetical protein